jgi:ketosteroid isomerase-like protein
MNNTKTTQEFINHFFHLVEIKDLSATMACFNPNAEFIDYFYPTVHMKGKQAIKNGLSWGFNGVETFGFNIVNYYESTMGNRVSIEIDTTHTLTNGKKINFMQIFLIDLENEKITRLQNYLPYGPHGIFKYKLMIQHLIHKIKQIRGGR